MNQKYQRKRQSERKSEQEEKKYKMWIGADCLCKNQKSTAFGSFVENPHKFHDMRRIVTELDISIFHIIFITQFQFQIISNVCKRRALFFTKFNQAKLLLEKSKSKSLNWNVIV